MAFKMRGPTFFRKSPIQHDLPGGEAHVHDKDSIKDFDVDTPVSEFTKFDKRTYVEPEEKIEPKKKKDTWYRDTDKDGNVISRWWKNRPRYKVIFNRSSMVPGFMKIVKKKGR